jgi:phage anti-repressor protein
MKEILPVNELALVAKSSSRFPVDFDLAWVWIGYSRKDVAKEALVNNFIKGEDFNLRQKAEVRLEGNREVKRPYEAIFLTVDCFKAFCMMARTEKGKEVRKYYLELEKKFFLDAKLKAKSIEARHSITDEWKRQGVSKPSEYGGLTRMSYYCLYHNPDVKKAGMDREQVLKLAAFESLEAWKLDKVPENTLGYHGCELSIAETAALIDRSRLRQKLEAAV